MAHPLLIRLILTLALTAPPAWAGAVALTFATEAVQTGERVAAPVRQGFAVAGFDGQTVPMRVVEGALQMRAYRLEGVRDNTLALLLPLQAQLVQAGFKVLFECETTACGGFDFRFGLDVLAEPQMHVDLGDFRYLVAENAGGDMVSLLVSKAADQGFVQVTTVTKGSVTPAPQVAPPKPELLVSAPPPPSGGLAEQVLATGSAALDDLVFASGKATLEERDYPSLAALAAWLQSDPGLTVTLVGHTDASGSLAVNVALSRQRAVAVRDRLIAKYGVPGRQIDAQGAGYLAPRATNQTPEGRQKNRRVEVMLTSIPVQ